MGSCMLTQKLIKLDQLAEQLGIPKKDLVIVGDGAMYLNGVTQQEPSFLTVNIGRRYMPRVQGINPVHKKLKLRGGAEKVYKYDGIEFRFVRTHAGGLDYRSCTIQHRSSGFLHQDLSALVVDYRASGFKSKIKQIVSHLKYD